MLEIKNLQTTEIQALANCNAHSERIAVQLNGEGKPRIVTIARAEVTLFQLFLKFFGFGKLATTQLDLRNVTKHLNEYDWKQAAAMDKQSEGYAAYLKVCSLANKALARQGQSALYVNVGTETQVKLLRHGEFHHNYSIYWNPCLKFSHIRDRVEQSCMYMTEIALGDCPQTRTFPCRNAFIKQENLKDVRIHTGHIGPLSATEKWWLGYK